MSGRRLHSCPDAVYGGCEDGVRGTNMQFGMRRWFDEDRNEWVNKMLTVVDGKVLNPCGYYLITKKGS